LGVIVDIVSPSAEKGEAQRRAVISNLLRYGVLALGPALFACLPAVVIDSAGWHPWGYSANSALVDPVYIDLTARLGNLMDLQQVGNIYASFRYEAFTYPPGAIFLFYPLHWMDYWIAVGLWTMLSLTSLLVVVALILTRTQPHLRYVEVWSYSCLISVVGVFAFPSIYECISLGQTGLLLLALVTIDFFLPWKRWQGILTGLAVAFKIYPIVFVLWWLYRRHFRAAFVSMIVAAVVSGLSFIVWPTSFRSYVHSILLGGTEVSHLDGGIKKFANSSLISPLLKPPLFSTPTTDWIQISFLALGIAVGLWTAGRLVARRPTTAFFVICLTSVWCSFVTWDHYLAFMILLPLTFREHPERWVRGALIAIAALSAIPLWRMRYVGGKGLSAGLERFVGSNGMWFLSLSFAMLCLVLALRSPSQRVAPVGHVAGDLVRS
jgi:alpha-1,2-mannosyltransferase